MARNSSPQKPEEIPKVSFRIVDPQEDALATGLTLKVRMDASTGTYRSYGFNPLGQDFVRDEHYIRYIEPIEAELAHQVEYDMDEQDREWLDALNDDRKAHQLDKVTYELFEIIMDKLEKEWFNLAKRIPSAAGDVPTEDSKCAICDDAEGENSNAIVFCDGCNLAVHQDCYGVPYIPEGQWLCRKCTVEPENPVDCIFCPAEAGAFKQTIEAHWAHLLCAIWIPEVGVSNPVYMEPIEGVDGVPKSRWKLPCSICRVKMGACIQCDNKNCFAAFHVTCARSQGLLGTMKGANHDGTLRAHCFRHLSSERQSELIEEGIASEEMLLAEPPTRASPAAERKRGRKANGGPPPINDTFMKLNAPAKQAKAARAHAKSYHDGPPLVPAIIVKAILDYTTKGKVRKFRELIERVCRYWSLKREARRGAPLLKRLYLEPWTASNASKEQTEVEKAKKLEYLVMVRNDLERVRMLAELVKKREAEKFRQAQILKAFVNNFLFPYDTRLQTTFDKIVALDRQNLFLEPVSRQDVPDYYAVIRRPMSWSVISEKISTHRYADLADFQADIFLTLDNAMKYNPSDNPYHKLASRIKKAACESLLDLSTSLAAEDRLSSVPTSDLEPADELLMALLGDRGAEQQDARDPLTALFSFEFEPLLQKELPPPPRKTPAERRIIRDAQLAQRIAQGLVLVRATRAMGPVEEEKVVAPPSTPRTVRVPARRDRKRAPNALPSPANSSRSDTVVPLARPQTGVAGMASYSPLDLQERLRRERGLGLIVDKVDDKDHFKRFNVGWVLPEGVKRGGRPSRSELPSIDLKRTARKGKAKPGSGTASRHSMDLPQKDPSSVVGPSIDESVLSAAQQGQTISYEQTRSGSSSSALSSLSDSESESRPAKCGAVIGGEALHAVIGAGPVSSSQDLLSNALQSTAAQDQDVGMFHRETPPHRQEEGESGPAELARLVEPLAAATESTAAAASENADTRNTAGRTKRGKLKRETDEGQSDDPSSRKKRRQNEPEPRRVGGSSALRSGPETTGMAMRAAESPSPPPMPSNLAGDGVVAGAPRRASQRQQQTYTGASKRKAARQSAVQETRASPSVSHHTRESSHETLDEEYEKRTKALHGSNGTGGPEAVADDPYPEGTLVWAKQGSFPFFPAAIVDVPEEYENISDAVWDMKPAQKEGVVQKVWLVRFYDKGRSFGWCPPGRIEPLGDNDEIDAMHLKGRDPKSNKSTFKGRAIANTVREAYESARAEIAIEGDEGYEA